MFATAQTITPKLNFHEDYKKSDCICFYKYNVLINNYTKLK